MTVLFHFKRNHSVRKDEERKKPKTLLCHPRLPATRRRCPWAAGHPVHLRTRNKARARWCLELLVSEQLLLDSWVMVRMVCRRLKCEVQHILLCPDCSDWVGIEMSSDSHLPALHPLHHALLSSADGKKSVIVQQFVIVPQTGYSLSSSYPRPLPAAPANHILPWLKDICRISKIGGWLILYIKVCLEVPGITAE